MRLTRLLPIMVVGIVFLGACTTPSEPQALPETSTPSPTAEPAEPPSTTTETTEPGQKTATSTTLIVNRTTHGRIRWDETWRGEIRITGDIIVEEGFTLTIEPDTKVLVAANSDVENLLTDTFLLKRGINSSDYIDGSIHPGEPYFDEGNHISILVRGTLYAVGNPDKMITITSDRPTPRMYDWNTFNFNHGILSYCIIEYYWNLGPGEDTVVSYNILRHVGGCAVCRGSGPALIEYNTISDAGHELIGLGNTSHTIRYNQIGPNPKGCGIVVNGPECSPQIINNTIIGCETGIAVLHGSPNITRNTMQDCNRAVTLLQESEDIAFDRDSVLNANTYSNNGQNIAYTKLPPWAQQASSDQQSEEIREEKYI